MSYKNLIMKKSQNIKIMLKIIDEIIILITAIDDIKISVEEVNILLEKVCYILKLEINLM
ncbi:hypothetical protein GX51_08328, partial [Blastomyces parvus]